MYTYLKAEENCFKKKNIYLHMLFCEVKNWQGTKLHLDPNQFILGTLTSLTCGVYLVHL